MSTSLEEGELVDGAGSFHVITDVGPLAAPEEVTRRERFGRQLPHQDSNLE